MSDSRRRSVLERLAQAIADGLDSALGRGVDIGLHGTYDDTDVTSRGLPLRAVMSSFDGKLQDCIIAVTAMREDVIVPAVAAAGLSIVKEFDPAPASVSPPVVHEFEEREEALEQLEALYGEATIHFTTPRGEFLLVIGGGLVASAEQLMFGAPEVADEGAFEFEPGLEEFLGTPLAASPAADPGFELPATVAPVPDELRPAGGGDPAGAIPVELADLSQPPTHAFDATAVENAIAASGNSQLAALLSGVEVEISAELGRTNMRLGDVASLHDDSVLTLDQLVDEPVRVYVNGSLYARARLVVVDNEYGVEILEVVGARAVTPLAA